MNRKSLLLDLLLSVTLASSEYMGIESPTSQDLRYPVFLVIRVVIRSTDVSGWTETLSGYAYGRSVLQYRIIY